MDLVGVKDVVVVDIADLADGAADEGVVIQLGAGGDLAGDDHEVGFDEGLAGDPAHRVLGQTGVEDGIRNGVANLVRMAFADGFGGENKMSTHGRERMPPFSPRARK